MNFVSILNTLVNNSRAIIMSRFFNAITNIVNEKIIIRNVILTSLCACATDLYNDLVSIYTLKGQFKRDDNLTMIMIIFEVGTILQLHHLVSMILEVQKTNFGYRIH